MGLLNPTPRPSTSSRFAKIFAFGGIGCVLIIAAFVVFGVIVIILTWG
jgi:hypothetical protein